MGNGGRFYDSSRTHKRLDKRPKVRSTLCGYRVPDLRQYSVLQLGISGFSGVDRAGREKDDGKYSRTPELVAQWTKLPRQPLSPKADPLLSFIRSGK